MKIKNCIFTKSDTTIVREWKVSKNEIYTGVDILADSVYSPFDGVVISKLTYGDGLYVIILQYNKDTCVKISNVKIPYVSLGQTVKLGTKIGICKITAHIEYLVATENDDEVLLPCRVSGLTYYAQNPTSLVLGEMKFPISGITETTIVNFTTKLDALPIISNEFGDNQ